MSTVCVATPMMAPERNALTVEYENGDSIRVSCKGDSESWWCDTELTVNGVKTVLTRELLGELKPIPDDGILFSDAASGRERYYSFRVSVLCPVELEMYQDTYVSCFANGLVSNGKVSDVQLLRFVTEDVNMLMAKESESDG